MYSVSIGFHFFSHTVNAAYSGGLRLLANDFFFGLLFLR